MNRIVKDGKVAVAVSFGFEGIEIVWLDEGTEFLISEYDGAEGIELKEDLPWQKA